MNQVLHLLPIETSHQIHHRSQVEANEQHLDREEIPVKGHQEKRGQQVDAKGHGNKQVEFAVSFLDVMLRNEDEASDDSIAEGVYDPTQEDLCAQEEEHKVLE